MLLKSWVVLLLSSYLCLLAGRPVQAQLPSGPPINGPGSTYAQAPHQRRSDAPRLPYGLALMARFDLLPRLRDSLCLQDSSYDRSGGNGDSGQFLQKVGNTAVLADIQGPGCIYRFWSANAEGHLKITFDAESKPRIDCPMQDLFLGKVSPFVAPLVAHKSGGWYCFFPMPFQRHCRIEVTDPGSLYYHVQYQRFPDGASVRTFTTRLTRSDESALQEVLAQWNHLGSPVVDSFTHNGMSERKIADTLLAPGTQQSFDLASGAAILTQLRAKIAPANRFTLRQVVLRLYWDGSDRPGIEAPIGDFFGSGFGDQRLRALPTAMTEDGYVCYWPMPFRHGARMTLENTGQTPVNLALTAKTDRLPWRDDFGYFHAQWHRQTTRNGEPFHILQTEGRGHYVGEHTDMQGDRGIGFLEGDEQIYVDAQTFPGIHGTGTEDFYTGGWYFDEGPFSLAYHGCTVKQEDMSRVGAYRFQIQDCVPFENRIKVDIEHGGENDYPGADYSCVAYWYQTTPDHDWSPIHPEQLKPANFHFADVMEAEDLIPVSGDNTTVVEDAKLPVEASASKVVSVSGTDLPFGFLVPQDDVYRLSLGQIRVPDCADNIVLTHLVDGMRMDYPLKRTDSTPAARWEPGITLRLKPGKARFALTVPPNKRIYLDYIRLEPSRREPGVIEAENLVLPRPASVDQGSIEVAYGPDTWSGRSALVWKPVVPQEVLTLPISIRERGDYAVQIAVVRDQNSPTLSAQLDDLPLNTVQLSVSAGSTRYERVYLGRIVGLAAGLHHLHLKVVPGATNPQLTLDYIRFNPSLYPNSLEAEELAVVDTRDGEATHQDMRGFGTSWSGNDQFWFIAQKVGAEATLELPVLKDAVYRLSAYYTTARDYAIVQVLIDGQNVGAPTDTYSEKVLAKGKTDLGQLHLTAGAHRVTFRVVGKNPLSDNFLVGVDAIGLEPVP